MTVASMTEILQKIRPEWGEKVRNKVQRKLHRVEVTDVDKLCFAVMDGSLNSKLAVAGEKRLCGGTLMKLRVELGKRHRELTSNDDSNPATLIARPKQCFCIQCLQRGGNPCLGVRCGPNSHSNHGIVQGAAKAPLDFGLSTARGARPAGSRVRAISATNRLPQPGCRASSAAYEGDFHFPMPVGSIEPEHFFPKMEPQPLQKSHSEPLLYSGEEIVNPRRNLPGTCLTHGHGHKAPKARRSNPILDHLPEMGGGMRRDDDALDGLLREAGEVISKAKKVKIQVGMAPASAEQPAISNEAFSDDLPKGPAFAALESKVLQMKTADHLDALNDDDFCRLESKLAAETAFEHDRTEVSSAATLMAVTNESPSRWQQPVPRNQHRNDPVWKKGKREQILKFYGEDSELKRRELLAQALKGV
jgi:hypothetical protein